MKKENKSKSDYNEARKKWAREQGEMFLDSITLVGEKIGTGLTPIQYVKAYQLCVDKYQFRYPAEFKIAELISAEETYNQTLALMTAIMKKFRMAFWKERKREASRKRR